MLCISVVALLLHGTGDVVVHIFDGETITNQKHGSTAATAATMNSGVLPAHALTSS
jgi:hypothetical protein